ncbi:MAG: zinc metalloprotease HtpX [Nanoarchaeota archaeon]
MIKNQLKTTFLLGMLAALFMGIGFIIGSRVGLIIGFTIAMLINFGSYWFSDKIVLKMYKAQPAPKDHKLYIIVKELSRRAKIPMPKVYIIQAPSPNAFATGRNPKNSAVAATQSLMDMLSDEEVEGVMAHELSHIKHKDTLIQTIAVGIASAISMVASMLQWALIFGMGGDEDNGVGGLVGSLIIIILTPIIATLIQLAISRSREFMADEGAVKMIKTPMPLIHALQKLEQAALKPHRINNTQSPTASLFIVNPFRGSAIANLFSTHPSTQKRVERMKKIKINR